MGVAIDAYVDAMPPCIRLLSSLYLPSPPFQPKLGALRIAHGDVQMATQLGLG